MFTVTPPITRHAGHSAHLRRQKMSYSTVFLFRITRSITMHFITLSVLKKERLSHVVCVVVVQDMTRTSLIIFPDFTIFEYSSSCSSLFFFVSFSLIFCLASHSALGMPLDRKRKQRSIYEAEKAIIT